MNGYTANSSEYPLEIDFYNDRRNKYDSYEALLDIGNIKCFGSSKKEVIELLLSEISFLQQELIKLSNGLKLNHD
ncbi:MAG: hypothetical protein WC917_00615 [Bacilli bacterium]